MHTSRFTSAAIIISLLLVAVCLLLCAFYNRFAADDFAALYYFRERGFTAALTEAAQVSNIRLFPLLQVYWVVSLQEYFPALALYTILSFTVLFAVLYVFGHSFLLPDTANRQQCTGMAFLLLLTFFSLSPAKGEQFFWLSASSGYLWALIAGLYLCVFFHGRREYQNKWLFILATAYLATSYEVLALTSGIYTGCLFLRNPKNRYALVAVIILFVLPASQLLLSGTSYRWYSMPPVSLPDTFRHTLLTIYSFFTAQLRFLPLIAGLLLLSGVQHAGISAKDLRPGPVFRYRPWWLLAVVAYTFAGCLLTRDVLSARAALPLLFIWSLALVEAGRFLTKFFRVQPLLCRAVLIMLPLLPAIALIHQYSILHRYTQAYDQRMQLLSQHPADPPALPPLPPSGWLYNHEISTDSSFFANQHLKQAFRLKEAPVLSRE